MAAIPAIVPLLTVASTAVGVYGAIQAGNARADAARYNAQVAEREQVVANQNRQLAIRTAQTDAEDKRRENRRVLASIRANFGASGLSLAGSPLDVLQDAATEQELDVQRIEYEGQVRGREGALRMLGLQDDAELSRAEARNASSAGRVSAFGTALSGAGTTLQRMN